MCALLCVLGGTCGKGKGGGKNGTMSVRGRKEGKEKSSETHPPMGEVPPNTPPPCPSSREGDTWLQAGRHSQKGDSCTPGPGYLLVKNMGFARLSCGPARPAFPPPSDVILPDAGDLGPLPFSVAHPGVSARLLVLPMGHVAPP